MIKFKLLFLLSAGLMTSQLASAQYETLSLVSQQCVPGGGTAVLTATWKNSSDGCQRTYNTSGTTCLGSTAMQTHLECKPVFCCCWDVVTAEPTIKVASGCIGGGQYPVWQVTADCE